ncbi:hypothetical protein COZ13_02680 [Candidatus Desantisbacteria bacterium CG_4_10_14_3_um_filter_40_18]|uniref:Lipoprotein n=1 Tax=Candidatus Desantisbacteria bacterium CG_4_10_14_3_um_filter_40_18 TaxID=1974544 RepID=A0A2M7P2S0_9BACT|nr:MAG: hypothetical protein COZ13_02680 [Candidatus Desantisbacteria bacterium CG_4_10_14_3_um_filter_40_18]
MNKTLNTLVIIVILSLALSGCSPAPTSNNVESGSVYINASTFDKNASQGEIVEFFSTVTHDIPNNSTIVVRASPESGNRWKFALCYGIECFISNGDKIIEKNIDLSPNSPLEFDVKIFVPEQANAGESSTVTFEIQSATSQTKTVSFTATAK